MSRMLEQYGYETTLVRGVEGPREGSMDDLARELGVAPMLISSLRRELGLHDARATLELARHIRRLRPWVLHTHAAKAGTVGRVAAMLSGRYAPRVRVHTFHGHVLTGYFSPGKARFFSEIERVLARRTSKLVAVSDEVRDDLVRLSIAPPSAIEVIPLGFDLDSFALDSAAFRSERRRVRGELGIADDERVATLVARLVPIKRVDRFLDIVGRLAATPDLRFVVVGDGELAEQLHHSPAATRLGKRLVWAGMRHDMPSVMAASDVVCLTSDNEGTPVSLIEAQAASKPVVSTNVGGVPSVVADGVSGLLVAPDDIVAFADRTRRLLDDPSLASGFGNAGRVRVFERFSRGRLAGDLDCLYRGLLA